MNDEQQEILSKILTLSKEVWDDNVSNGDINQWLKNFTGKALPVKEEHLNAMHLLSHFTYFGSKEIRQMLKSLYRDLFKYPIIQNIRGANGNTRNMDIINSAFAKELDSTRFLGMGNPSESGSHLLYYFRQESSLSRDLFIHQHEVLDKAPGSADAKLAIPGLKRLVFIDDLLGSGSQASQYSTKLLTSIRAAAKRENKEIEILYFTLFAKPEGLKVARALVGFDRVETIHELGPTDSAFNPESRVYNKTIKGISLEKGKALAFAYGSSLGPGHELGFGNGQLLLGLHHNVPDNTLPIFWFDGTAVDWNAIFPRYNKVY